MARRPVQDSEAAGHDSFLDVVTNMVGIMVILVMVCGMKIQQSARAPKVDVAQVEKAQAKAATIEAELMDMTAQTKQFEAEAALRRKQHDELATLVAAIEAQIAGSRDAGASAEQADMELRTQLASARLDLERLEQERRIVAAAPSATVEIVNLPTPLSAVVIGKEAHFVLSKGRIAFIPLDALLEKFKAQATAQARAFAGRSELTDAVGPEGGFRLRYTLERRDLGGSMGRSGYEIRLNHWKLLPTRSDLGETLPVALGENSDFRFQLSRLSPQRVTITCWVYPDSFAEFREIKKELFRLGYDSGARPLPAGMPVSGSPSGSRSSAQ